MSRSLTLEFWVDDGWFIGWLKEVPSVFSQGETIKELEENIRDAYPLMLETEPTLNRMDVILSSSHYFYFPVASQLYKPDPKVFSSS